VTPSGNTTIRMALALDAEKGGARARWSVRLAAYRLAASCEHLLDELNRLGDTSIADAIGRVLLATRTIIALTAADGGSAEPLFDQSGRPSVRLKDAHRRIVDAIELGLPARTGADKAGLVTSAVEAIRDQALNLLASFAAETAPVVVPEAGAPARARVLIVDDEPLMLNLLQRAVRGLGHDTTTTSDGHEALRIATEGGIDLVMTDIEMPAMNGLMLLEKLKADARTKMIPVIVISSLDDMRSVTRCIELGAEDHIAKPFEAQLLSARVRSSLDRKRYHDEEASHRHAVSGLIAAAEAVEQDMYASDTVAALLKRQDGLGRLARVFDRMVTGLKSREERLRTRLKHLQREVSAVNSGSTTQTKLARTSDDAAFQPGTIVSGRYEIRGQLGEGGMGTVYTAYDKDLNIEIALKSVRADVLAEDPTLLDRLKTEILLARRISHPNVVRSHDHGSWKGNHYITMELVQGISLADLLDQRGRLPVSATLAIGTQLCDALGTAHEAEIIHRDIKPANLIVDDAGVLKVMDFGIARSIGVDYEGHTAKGHVIGTPRYMAPEVLMGGKVTGKSDLFAVGVVLFECLTGMIPYYADTPAELVAAIYQNSAPPVDSVAPNVPPEFAKLIHQQLAFDPSRRAASGRELAQKLSEIEVSAT
jgi:CheY-like chemotaxis protein